ncbi:Zn(II)2Cys6 transcription factor [Aspergillus affinis]|uniref:Zn(II)2Cys6 transcription factor n=1 Tax=Aspergillus affinis TaxID=1070780 RepID=UPI0022FE977D|nr:Zn(II)2Cys6 transcription factor [Aspergillus affinis]KAI9043464.1 Zn(II)2Cys6 transcription factor [Aspergillus affinis]
MEASPPKARGSGRSGPRRRTGCLTCRARKVRCDEAKPNCANCVRLHLQCSYKTIVPGLVARHNGHTQKPVRTAVSTVLDRPDLNFFNTVLRPDERRRQSIHAHLPEQGQQSVLESPARSSSAPDFQGAFDMLGFIGEITSDLEQKHLDLTNGLSDFPLAVDISSPVQAESRPIEDIPTVDSGYSDAGQNDFPLDMGRSESKATYQEQLMAYFMDSEAPPTIFGSVSLEWSYIREVIAALARECSILLNSIYCYSDIHKAMKEGKRWRMAPAFHQQASSDIQTYLQGAMNTSTLKRVFTAVFLLMMAELMSTPESWRPETSYLHSAYLLLRQYRKQINTWIGFGHLIVSWVSLLDVKALIAGREGDPLLDLGTLSKPTTSNHELNPLDDGYEEEHSLLSQPAYLVQHAITAPAFHFFTQTQQVIRRIVSIDLHHRSRGTVSDEFGVLQIAHQVNADLESLWNTRPRILDIYNRPKTHLFDTLRPTVATQICRTFRQYVANFLAIFIYLHRVAFVIYPRTDRVHRAVDQIIQLATVEASGASSLPIGFLWPLFVAGLEGSHEQRAWIIKAMQRMAGPDSQRQDSHEEEGPYREAQSHGVHDSNPTVPEDNCAWVQRHPNAAKALLLLEEMTRRQDTSRTWADSRCVRGEMFTDFFVMI